ncbi:ABC transporter ATP-binding protein [Caminibacter pacificus]|uniref:ABC transporter ATP-binding protein n=2 Tax=Caminibacter pacificus TaxID=1424653 RepID=A0AAJ4RC70_9BACT|nr:ABC transporter ATP-binding protein [Caminibacter pacificus]QCI28855.1 ABC transporter ATP-binding protein [Caminibacter pacificus]ROR39444.1 branched-chain amino acid transport system ATP-binding protein [Caminibacter pacificus]
MLKVDKVTKQFGGVVAIKDVSFEVKPLEIFALVGPNGAGKTTLFNIITGVLEPTSGKVYFKDEDITGLSPVKIVEKGIARTFQNIRLFSSLTVLENVLIGFHNHIEYNFFESLFRLPRFFKQEKIHKEKAMEILKFLGIEQYADYNAKALSYGNQRKVEIARALATEPDLLLLDEPAAGMNPKETDELADTVFKLRSEMEKTILFIEHDMKFVQKIADRVMVLDYGKTIFEGKPADMMKDETVIKAYLGDIDVEG